MPKISKAELEQAEAIIKEALDEEQRAPDQTAAMEAAFVAGTLPEADRRAETAGEMYLAETLAALPAGSTVSWSQGVFRVTRLPNAVGEASTLARAIRLLGSQYGHDGDGHRVLLDEVGEPIPAE